VRDPELDQLIEEITTDAYGDEGFDAFACHFGDELGLPVAGRVIGEDVEVLHVFFDGDERRGLTARCRRGTLTYEVALLDIVFPDGSGARRFLAAYRQWLGLEPWPTTGSNDL
jgi:hypothetical protein